MKNILFVVLLLSAPVSAQAISPEGDIKRGGADGSVIVWKSFSGSCYAIDLKNVKAKIPTVWTSAFSVLSVGLRPLRESSNWRSGRVG